MASDVDPTSQPDSVPVQNTPRQPEAAEISSDVTRLLRAAQQGDSQASADLLTALYSELRRLAAYRMSLEAPGQTIQPTALVHEAWLKLRDRRFEDRKHFFNAAAQAMRRIIVDRARYKQAQRHGGGRDHLPLDEDLPVETDQPSEEILAVHDALEKFARHNPARAELVSLRYFAGLTMEETADVLGISVPTAKRWWDYAKAWLYGEIQGPK